MTNYQVMDVHYSDHWMLLNVAGICCSTACIAIRIAFISISGHAHKTLRDKIIGNDKDLTTPLLCYADALPRESIVIANPVTN
jgi:hypothetical protein